MHSCFLVLQHFCQKLILIQPAARMVKENNKTKKCHIWCQTIGLCLLFWHLRPPLLNYRRPCSVCSVPAVTSELVLGDFATLSCLKELVLCVILQIERSNQHGLQHRADSHNGACEVNKPNLLSLLQGQYLIWNYLHVVCLAYPLLTYSLSYCHFSKILKKKKEKQYISLTGTKGYSAI